MRGLVSSRILSLSVWMSYGVSRNIINFLEPDDQIQLQKLNKFYYRIAVSRVQIKVVLPITTFFLNNFLSTDHMRQICAIDREDGKIKWQITDRMFSQGEAFHSVQVLYDIFILSHHVIEPKLAKISNITSDNKVSIDVKAKPLRARSNPSFINHRNQFLFSIGGWDNKSIEFFHKSVDIYSIELDLWQIGAPLNIPRHSASSCAINDLVYTFCGHYGTFNLDSIEKINAKDASREAILDNSIKT